MASYRSPLFPTLAGLTAAMGLAACGGNLTHRSVAEFAHTIDIPAGTERVRIEIQNGTVEFMPPEQPGEAAIQIRGGVRRAADTAELLGQLEQVAVQLAAVPTDERGLLLLRGPTVPEGTAGMIGYEANVRVPTSLPLEVVVSANGNVDVQGRRAPTVVRTGRGDLVFGDCRDVTASTGRGNVIAYDHRGALDVHTKTGDMQALIPAPSRLIELVTGQGNVQLQLPEATGFEVDARAETGKIGNSFGLESRRVGDYGAALVGRRGDGAIRIVLRTGSGHLALSKRDFDR